ncbi:MAG: FAD-dependent oxidoreductase [Candidatus Latescibacterota bacterium]|jgi:glycine/D-amino acid oxidase-like deaminating enzyme
MTGVANAVRVLEAEVVVAGGGAAGVPCALAAARCGARTILVHDRPVLGGNASSEVRMHIVGADASGGRGEPLMTEAREGGVIEEIRLETCVRNPQRSASMLDLILYEKCRAESALTLLLNTAVTGVEMDGNRIAAARAIRTSTEEEFCLRAPVFVDCTGDGRLGAAAGAPFRQGREGREEYGESTAAAGPDHRTLGSSLLFMARRHDRPIPFTAPPWARRFTEADLHLRPHASPGVDRGLEYGYWWCEWGGELDTIRDNEAIRDELLAVLLGVWDHVKNGGDHGAANWALDWFGFLPGKRESRRFIGRHVLTETEVMASHPFGDAIAYGGWPIDTHPPAGIDATEEPPCRQEPVPWLFDIPLSACVGREVPNLFFAGRDLSATHLAFASTRVMATCAAVGQGVGTAAAYAVRHGISPADLPDDPATLTRIRQRLLRDDAFLIGEQSRDLDDLALRARLAASSEQPAGEAAQVCSGQTRAVHGKGGARPERAFPAAHRWMSDPAQGLPAWLELGWDEPVRPAEVRLVFDTGLNRPLTLSHSDAFTERMIWGRPQPETVADYLLQGEVDGEWVGLAEVRGNYQRLRVHRLEAAPPVRALRLTVLATHGLDHARICELRVYERISDWPRV